MTHYDDLLRRFQPIQTPDQWRFFEVDRRHLRTFLAGYLAAIAFTDGSAGDELEELDLTVEGDGGWGEGQLRDMIAECDAFQLEAAGVIARHIGLGDLSADGQRYGYDRLAHDFWLTRNGHGAGFWDRKFTTGLTDDPVEGLGDALTALVGHGTSYPQRDAYRGDDGRAYLA